MEAPTRETAQNNILNLFCFLSNLQVIIHVAVSKISLSLLTVTVRYGWCREYYNKQVPSEKERALPALCSMTDRQGRINQGQTISQLNFFGTSAKSGDIRD
jgi:hypothetical protein